MNIKESIQWIVFNNIYKSIYKKKKKKTEEAKLVWGWKINKNEH